MQIAQILQLRVAPRATPGAIPRATPKMIYYCACPTQTAARIEKYRSMTKSLEDFDLQMQDVI